MPQPHGVEETFRIETLYNALNIFSCEPQCFCCCRTAEHFPSSGFKFLLYRLAGAVRTIGTRGECKWIKKLLRAAHLMSSRRGVCKWKISRWIKNKVPKREHENEVGLRDQRGLGSWADTSSISLPANMRGQSVLGLKINRRSRGIIKKQSATKGDLTRAPPVAGERVELLLSFHFAVERKKNPLPSRFALE